MNYDEMQTKLLEAGQNVNGLDETLKVAYDEATNLDCSPEINKLIGLIRIAQQTAQTTATMLDDVISNYSESEG